MNLKSHKRKFNRKIMDLYTSSDLYFKVIDIIKNSFPDKNKKIRALDIPAGAGALTKFLKEEMKFDVSACEIDTKKWSYSNIPVLYSDLGRKIPFNDENFDLVICLEGIKHVTDISTAISELKRVLKKDGILILTFPNDLCMQSRLRYFFSGFVDTDWKIPMSSDPNCENEIKKLHLNSLISYPYLDYFIRKNYLEIKNTYADRLRALSIFLAILFYPIIFYVTSKSCKNNQKLKSEMLNFKWLAGRRNILFLKKIIVKYRYI